LPIYDSSRGARANNTRTFTGRKEPKTPHANREQHCRQFILTETDGIGFRFTPQIVDFKT